MWFRHGFAYSLAITYLAARQNVVVHLSPEQFMIEAKDRRPSELASNGDVNYHCYISVLRIKLIMP